MVHKVVDGSCDELCRIEIEFQGEYTHGTDQGVDFWWIDWQQGTHSKIAGVDLADIGAVHAHRTRRRLVKPQKKSRQRALPRPDRAKDGNLLAGRDLEIDAHHTVEDLGICLGEACKKALGDKSGVRRYGRGSMPMHEALAAVVLDFSGRPFLVYNVPLPKAQVGNFELELVEEDLHRRLIALVLLDRRPGDQRRLRVRLRVRRGHRLPAAHRVSHHAGSGAFLPGHSV